jgi:hypothetical protein
VDRYGAALMAMELAGLVFAACAAVVYDARRAKRSDDASGRDVGAASLESDSPTPQNDSNQEKST